MSTSPEKTRETLIIAEFLASSPDTKAVLIEQITKMNQDERYISDPFPMDLLNSVFVKFETGTATDTSRKDLELYAHHFKRYLRYIRTTAEFVAHDDTASDLDKNFGEAVKDIASKLENSIRVPPLADAGHADLVE